MRGVRPGRSLQRSTLEARPPRPRRRLCCSDYVVAVCVGARSRGCAGGEGGDRAEHRAPRRHHVGPVRERCQPSRCAFCRRRLTIAGGDRPHADRVAGIDAALAGLARLASQQPSGRNLSVDVRIATFARAYQALWQAQDAAAKAKDEGPVWRPLTPTNLGSFVSEAAGLRALKLIQWTTLGSPFPAPGRIWPRRPLRTPSPASSPVR